MQPWTAQRGQCIFCNFRGTLRTTAKPHNLRSFHVSPSLFRDREFGRSSDEKELRYKADRTDRRQDAVQKHFDSSRKSLRIRRPSLIKPDPRLVLKSERIEERLRVLKERLESTTASDESDVTQLASLDPTGKHWEDFVGIALSVTKRNQSETWSAAQRKLSRELNAANRQELWREELVKALHYGFIDHVLGTGNAVAGQAQHKFSDLRYPTEWYTGARQMQRDIHLHVGPTNSGKTYNALKRLEESKNGFYAGPLRLLAHEVFSRFRARGIPCDLVTGDDVRLDENPEVKMYASTVEMVDVNRQVDVAVIDEIQMMAAEDRGWAWTRAFLGSNAKEVHLCGEERVVPLIRELAASMGDTLHIHRYERLNPLKSMSRSLRGNLKNLRKGDCVVSFSIMGIHALKKQIELETGRRVAIVYGSLPPETRAQQAALFNDPDNDYDYLVASDAIGMGLNL